MIAITWDIIVYVLILVCTLVFVLTRDNTPHWFGYNREWALFFWVVLALVFTAIWGGVFWW